MKKVKIGVMMHTFASLVNNSDVCRYLLLVKTIILACLNISIVIAQNKKLDQNRLKTEVVLGA